MLKTRIDIYLVQQIPPLSIPGECRIYVAQAPLSGMDPQNVRVESFFLFVQNNRKNYWGEDEWPCGLNQGKFLHFGCYQME